ncbi:trans-2-enoyl-reductase [Colletotrichum kahawae]|uniref:enoyl-[acyl-carrier-protein] reductase n=1 Tax=Colletotrichum kahawae TaxID=34407 RepID=A0AAE0D6U4_COLKA|nr:trans-2-enoyl-reductase [Colletotrichum kahawae]
MAKSLVQNEPGLEPALRLVTDDIPSIDHTPDQVLVRFLAVPLNTVDLMVLNGKYPVKPRFSVDGRPVPGFEGCAIVVESNSSQFAKDDVVVTCELGLGTWRTHDILPAHSLLKLPRDTPPLAASLMRSGILVAWLLCEEVTSLVEGDWVIMSAGTSCVAQFFMQLARKRGIRTAMVVRDRVDMTETTNRLMDLGASVVISESKLAREKASAIPRKLVLALDSVFGAVGQTMLDSLAVGGKYVMMGMLGGPLGTISVGTEHLFQKQITVMSFRGSVHWKRIGKTRADAICEMLACLLIKGELKCPDVTVVDWKQADGNDEALELLANESIQTARNRIVGSKKIVWLPSQ